MKKENDPQTLQPALMSNFALLWGDFGVLQNRQFFSRTSWYFCAVDVAGADVKTDVDAEIDTDAEAGAIIDKHKI